MIGLVDGQRVRVAHAYSPGQWEIIDQVGTIAVGLDERHNYIVYLDNPVTIKATGLRTEFALPEDLVEPLSLLELLAEAAA